VLRLLREHEPVSWVPFLGGWLVTRRDIVLRVLRDAETFTVDDPRFTTSRVVGPSMLSLDGAEHKRHRDPFTAALRLADSGGQLTAFAEAAAARLVAELAPAGRGELRRGLAGPLAVAVVAEILGLGRTEPGLILSWYDAIVRAVSDLAGQQGSDGQPGGAAGAAGRAPGDGGATGARGAAGARDVSGARGAAGARDAAGERGAAAFGMLRASLEAAMAGTDGRSVLAGIADGGLSTSEVVSNAAVLMFGGIETTEGMICNAVLHLLSHPDQASQVIAEPGLAENAIEESLRFEPAAAVVDRYATGDVTIGGAAIRRGDLVTVSLAGANRDPAFFDDPDTFDVHRASARQNLGFARGPHFCIGAHLARLETRAAILELLDRLPGLRLDPGWQPAPRGLVFRKPPELHVAWDTRERPATPPGSSAWRDPASNR
jgi:cytochrome P450